MKHPELYLLLALIFLSFYANIEPSNDRVWEEDQRVLPFITFHEDVATVHNIRNFTYESTTNYTSHYYTKSFNLSEIVGVYYIVEPFSEWEGAAHTFFSFEFKDNNFIAVSIEIRKEKGEVYSALKGLFKQYELMYVFGDEQDLVKLRSNFRNDDVYIYPTRANTSDTTLLFLDIAKRTNKLHQEPEFYHTFLSSCTTNIVEHVNTVSPSEVSWFDFRIFAPGYSDRLAYEGNLLDTGNLSFEEARKKFKINERAKQYANSPDFSVKIRE